MIEQLRGFAYQDEYLEYFRRRLEWFEQHSELGHVMWRIPAGEIPSLDECQAGLAHLSDHGPTAAGFRFRDATSFEPEWIPVKSPIC